MRSEWKTGIRIEGGSEIYKVYRLKNKAKGNLETNREYMSKAYVDKENAESIAKMYNEKEAFVHELGEVLSDFGVENIDKLRYDIDLKKKDEIVTVTFLNQYEKEINVTCCGLRGIINEIIRKL